MSWGERSLFFHGAGSKDPPPWGQLLMSLIYKKVQVGIDQEKAQSEKDSHSKNRGGKKPN